MFPTVIQQPLREDRSSEKEKTDLPNALRAAANMTSRTRQTLTTAGTGTFTTAWTSDDMPEGVAWSIDAVIICRGLGARGHFGGTALYYREPGGATIQQGAFGTTPITSNVAITAQFALVGNAIAVQVRDDGATTTAWDVLVELMEVS